MGIAHGESSVLDSNEIMLSILKAGRAEKTRDSETD